ncbi:hypothetical protein GUJ93_ZPchr0012g21362 [Zizania palustris]|uniref:Uncharacterized protein n=1 Tax=Zizania palustris TaxID=103762 RepID=A0A8J5WPL1_ZIZPA|nr:hypothetical protein GUJ93_ZPchr0012g21362 [Zizania palustris]
MIVELDGGGMELGEEWYPYGAVTVSSATDRELCARLVRELRAELELERRMRRKAEARIEVLAAELGEERRRSGAAEAECRRLREDVGDMRAEVERALQEIDEERRMLHVAELWREERVQMKLADAKAAMEERLQEIAGAKLTSAAAAAAAIADGNKTSRSPTTCKSSSTVQHAQQSQAASGQLHRREIAGGENPHIRRGIKGFVEFPRAVRVRPERVDLVSNLECQRAQLRVLTRRCHRHRNPPAGMGLAAASDNLVV